MYLASFLHLLFLRGSTPLADRLLCFTSWTRGIAQSLPSTRSSTRWYVVQEDHPTAFSSVLTFTSTVLAGDSAVIVPLLPPTSDAKAPLDHVNGTNTPLHLAVRCAKCMLMSTNLPDG